MVRQCRRHARVRVHKHVYAHQHVGYSQRGVCTRDTIALNASLRAALAASLELFLGLFLELFLEVHMRRGFGASAPKPRRSLSDLHV